VRNPAKTASLYGRTAARVFARGRGRPVEDRLVFVVGSPRSGTTFVAGAIGGQPGFVDLGEVLPLKAELPELASLPADAAARRLRAIVERVRLLGLARGSRAVEQTPETAFLVEAALLAYPRARVVHVVRDGRDVVCSLLERGWLSPGRTDSDDARLGFGPHARFWVEEERRDEFPRVSDATRAAWMWRRYLTAARGHDSAIELRYEALAAGPQAAATDVARFLGSDPGPLAEGFAEVHARSVGRWREELTAEQLADVEREAGALLRELGYSES
jgi:hypothetical protein